MPKVRDQLNVELRAVVYREGAWTIAHCLELDVVAEGSNSQEALRSLLEMCDMQIETADREGDLEAAFRPAPAKFWKLYAQASEAKLPRKPKKPIHRFTARELVLG